MSLDSSAALSILAGVNQVLAGVAFNARDAELEKEDDVVYAQFKDTIYDKMKIVWRASVPWLLVVDWQVIQLAGGTVAARL